MVPPCNKAFGAHSLALWGPQGIICPSGLAWHQISMDRTGLLESSYLLQLGAKAQYLSPTLSLPVFPASLSSSVSASAYRSPSLSPLNAPGIRTQVDLRISPSFFQLMPQVAAGILQLGAG